MITEQKDDIIDFTKFLNTIRHPFLLLRNYVKLLLIYVISALVLAVILKFTLPPLYEATCIIKSNESKDLYYLNMLYDLQTLVKGKDYEVLSDELKIPEEDVTALKKLTLFPIINPKSADSSAVCLTFRTNDYTKFRAIQDATISYLENNFHYQKVKDIRLSNIDSLKKKINKDIREMDSVKRIIINNIKAPTGNGNGLVYNVPVDPYKAYDINMGRYKEELWLINQKKYTSSFELIKPCVASKKPMWPKFELLVFILVPVSVFIMLIHAHRREQHVTKN